MVAKAIEKCRRLVLYVKAYFTSVHFLIHYINVNTDTMQPVYPLPDSLDKYINDGRFGNKITLIICKGGTKKYKENIQDRLWRTGLEILTFRTLRKR